MTTQKEIIRIILNEGGGYTQDDMSDYLDCVGCHVNFNNPGAKHKRGCVIKGAEKLFPKPCWWHNIIHPNSKKPDCKKSLCIHCNNPKNPDDGFCINSYCSCTRCGKKLETTLMTNVISNIGCRECEPQLFDQDFVDEWNRKGEVEKVANAEKQNDWYEGREERERIHILRLIDRARIDIVSAEKRKVEAEEKIALYESEEYIKARLEHAKNNSFGGRFVYDKP